MKNTQEAKPTFLLQMMLAEADGNKHPKPLVISATTIQIDPAMSLPKLIQDMDISESFSEGEISLMQGFRTKLKDGRIELNDEPAEEQAGTLGLLLQLYHDIANKKFSLNSLTRIVNDDGTEMVVVKYNAPEPVKV